MSTIPMWLLGRWVTIASISACDINGYGQLILRSAQALAGRLDEIGVEITTESEDISAVSEYLTNTVIVKRDLNMVLREILVRGPVGNVNYQHKNILAAVATHPYCYITFARGSQTWSMYGSIKGYREEIRRGKSTGALTVQLCGIAWDYT